jgi:hypothetical protein
LGGWDSVQRYVYESHNEVLADIRFRDQFWCRHCDRALFFLKACGVHVDVDAETVDGSVESAASDMFWEVMSNANLDDVLTFILGTVPLL